MAADSIRGDGIFIAQNALRALLNDPEQLSLARQRFEEPPPPYRSQSSGQSTVLESPSPPSEERRRRSRADWRCRLQLEYHGSHPGSLFRKELSAECRRVDEQVDKGVCRVPIGVEFHLFAYETLRKRWVEQGIWSEKWTARGGFPEGKWKHEEPPELESQSESDSEVESPIFLGHLCRARAPKPRRVKSDEELQRIAQRERERSASRPFYRFMEQVSREREWLQEVSRLEGSHVADSPEINTMAYTAVKNAWIEWGVWYRKWQVLPGMSWKHELPLEQFLREEMGEEPPDDAPDHTALDALPLPNLLGAVATCQPSGAPEPMLSDNIQQTSDMGPPDAPDPDSAGNVVQSTVWYVGGGNSPADLVTPIQSPAASSPHVDADMPHVDMEQPNGEARHAGAQAAPRRRGRPRRSHPKLPSATLDVPKEPPESAPTPRRRSKRLEEARRRRGPEPPATTTTTTTSLNGPGRSRRGRITAADAGSRDGRRAQKRRAARK
ncbi:hypothetical protein NOR_08066 [Metarhizium rileyi]|uniref:Uncharacterized protein n=1 Tax=Metarhizium rileyi (strain RCEF 4871) TaxID=1649241 RepID=A0A166X105_METRR|nr:hypothetical protein NOR_08066 [Metarhizium rileyi RCEF 4871]TWU71792.1 hypothetical protein ED733_003645 [Metarhizium rileyi]